MRGCVILALLLPFVAVPAQADSVAVSARADVAVSARADTIALPAQAETRVPRLAPAPGCSAPALWPASAPQPESLQESPSPLRRAMLSCVGQTQGARKRPVRWT
jgi:hypothetical protein